MTNRHAEPPQAIDASTATTNRQSWTATLIAAYPIVLLLRDGKLLLYLRTRSPLYQCRDLSFETTFAERVSHKLFRFSDGYQPPSLKGTFRQPIRDAGLLKNEDGQNRALHSLIHTYATFELLCGGTDIHTLSKQMGNSAAMLEKHYLKLTAAMAANRMA